MSSLEAYAFPALGHLSVNLAEIGQVRDVLAPISLTKHETARRVRLRKGSIIDWAVAKGYREHPLPMAAVNKILPKVKKSEKHLKALPYPKISGFLRSLKQSETMGRLALEAAILTACRSGEVRLVEWDELNLEAKLWTIPHARMKADREHVIQLSDRAVTLFQKMADNYIPCSPLIFPGQNVKRPLSDMALMKVLRDMNLDATVHGFRSCFRDWVAEETEFEGEIAEMTLAHSSQNKTEAAYRRGNLLAKCRTLMDAWGAYCMEKI